MCRSISLFPDQLAYAHQHNQEEKCLLLVKFTQASNCCKRVLEAAKLAYVNKIKESILSQKLGY